MGHGLTILFIWNNEFHELKDSGPIGLSLMVTMAEGFLQHIEGRATRLALQRTSNIQLKSYKRYVDDSHARFPNVQQAEVFKEILNQQHPNIQYTIEFENMDKELQFLDITVKNEKKGNYEFSVYRKEAITNIQVKHHSNHDPTILRGIFKGFVYRAFTICSETHIEEDLKLLINMFMQNGYKKDELLKSIEEVREKSQGTERNETTEEITQSKIIKLPWIPGLSPKLRKVYRKAGVRTVFKSGPNLKTILTSQNKSKLPRNSYPGVYKIECSEPTHKPYIGETKMQVRNRKEQHRDYIKKGQWENSGLAQHKRTCCGTILWDDTVTVKKETSTFNRKVREALEIQYNKCGPTDGGMNLDEGQFVRTLFWTPFFKHLKSKYLTSREHLNT